MQLQDDPFAQLPQFGQPDAMQGMAGPSGFAGQMPNPMGGMFGQTPQPQEHHHNGFNPAFLMGVLPGLLAGGHLSSIAPLFGLAGMLGPKLFK